MPRLKIKQAKDLGGTHTERTIIVVAFTQHQLKQLTLFTQHAVNAFLSTSVAFINELARICELVGADAKEVERGLKSEQRIGPKAYLSPGSAFAGGTLARDVGFLLEIAGRNGRPAHLFKGVRESNECQKNWLRDQLSSVPAGATVAVLGLTYKPGTDTLRRSGSVELCKWLMSRGVKVRAHDPAVIAQV